MPEFAWRAADASGRVTEGRIDAATQLIAARQLRDRGLVPVSIQDASAPGSAVAATAPPALSALMSGGGSNNGPVTPADVLTLTSELAIMLRAGLALASALRVLIDMSHKPSVARMLQQVLDDVKGGAPLSRALARERELFGEFYLNMIRSGEASGELATVLARLVEHMERLRALRESVVSATIYPAILLAVAVISLIAMLGFVVPQFEKLFTDMGDALPLATRIVMRAGQVFRNWGLEIAVGVGLASWLMVRWMRSPAGASWWQARILRAPLFGRLMLKFQLNLFARTLGTLLGNGVPMLTALNIATETVGNQVLRLELANILNREVETGIRRTLTLIEPLLIIVLGLLIAGIIVSIMLGILSINDLAV